MLILNCCGVFTNPYNPTSRAPGDFDLTECMPVSQYCSNWVTDWCHPSRLSNFASPIAEFCAERARFGKFLMHLTWLDRTGNRRKRKNWRNFSHFWDRIIELSRRRERQRLRQREREKDRERKTERDRDLDRERERERERQRHRERETET